eukprot:426794-Alexandrium_andersonii.AAC.1
MTFLVNDRMIEFGHDVATRCFPLFLPFDAPPSPEQMAEPTLQAHIAVAALGWVGFRAGQPR